jgi:hypothetical protein
MGLPVKIGPELTIGGKGCFKNRTAFRGRLTELNIWDRPLSNTGNVKVFRPRSQNQNQQIL